MSAQVACPSELALERHLAGLSQPDEAVTPHILGCALCGDRLRAMRAEGDAFMLSDSARATRQILGELAAPSTPGWRRWLWALVPLAVAAGIGAFVGLRPATTGPLTAMGAPTLQLLVGREGAVSPWHGQALAPGDVLQLHWTGDAARWVAVLGKEESGSVEAWFPTGPEAALLPAGNREVGDALRFDPPFHGAVFLMVSEEPFALRPALDAIRQGGEPHISGRVTRLDIPTP